MQIDELLSIWEQKREQGEQISAEELCAEHPLLLAEVREQIRALEGFESRFAYPCAGKMAANVEGSSVESRVCQQLQIASEYQITQHHASGGLGDVYLAVEPRLNRRVAIKFPNAKRASSQLLARFEREARITGRLDHPGIVAVHALQQPLDGQACYVMRFVSGPTLHERVASWHQSAKEQKRMPFAGHEFRQMLQHFIALCNTVAYAHGQHVLHRDIKPSNVILGPYGETFLMDWGLAREIDLPREDSGNSSSKQDVDASTANAKVGDHLATVDTAKAIDTDEVQRPPNGKSEMTAQFTRQGQFCGTPGFAAPEQMLGQWDNVHYPADIFSLGATLFYLLTGSSPVRDPGSKANLERLKQGEILLAPFLQSTPAPLRAICLRALEFSPENRYEDVLGLASDVESYLADEPVSALKESWSNRTMRWLRKNRTFTLTAASALGLLSLFSVLVAVWVSGLNSKLTLSNQQLSQSNQDLLESRQREGLARRAAEDNYDAAREAVLEYLVRIDDNEKLDQADFSELKRGLLSTAKPFLERLRGRSTDDSEIDMGRIEATYRLALIEQQSSNPKVAEQEYSSCVTLIQAARTLDPDNVELIGRLASCYENLAILLRKSGEPKRSEQHFRDALDLVQSALQRHPKHEPFRDTLHSALVGLGSFMNSRGDQAQAAQYLEQAVQSLGEHLANFPESIKAKETLATAHQQLGFVMRETGKVPESLEHRRQALEIYEQLVQQFPNRVRSRTYLSMSRLNLGVMLAESGQVDEARNQYLEALKLQQQLAAEFPSNATHSENAAKTLGNLANLVSGQASGALAEDYFRQAIEVYEKLCERLPQDNTLQIGLARTHYNLAYHQMKQSPARAIETFRQVETILYGVKERMPDHLELRSNLRNLHGGRASAHGLLYQPLEAQREWLLAAKYDEGPNRPFFEQQAAEAENRIEKVTQFEKVLNDGLATAEPELLAEFADFCRARQRTNKALEGFRQAFADQAELVSRFGDKAAVSALALIDEAKEGSTSSLSIEQCEELRALALQWLNGVLDSQPEAAQVRQQLRQWTLQPYLSAMRNPGSIGDLTEAEIQAWNALWRRGQSK